MLFQEPPFDSYFLHGLTEGPLELIVLFEVRMKQTAMIEIHFLSGKNHQSLPPVSSLSSPPLPFKHSSIRRAPAHFFCRIFQGFFFFPDANQGCQTRFHRPAGPRCIRQGPEDLQKRVQHCKKKAWITPEAKHFQQICTA